MKSKDCQISIESVKISNKDFFHCKSETPTLKQQCLDTSLAQLITMQKYLSNQINQLQKDPSNNHFSHQNSIPRNKVQNSLQRVLSRTVKTKIDLSIIKQQIKSQMTHCIHDIKFLCQQRVSAYVRTFDSARFNGQNDAHMLPNQKAKEPHLKIEQHKNNQVYTYHQHAKLKTEQVGQYQQQKDYLDYAKNCHLSKSLRASNKSRKDGSNEILQKRKSSITANHRENRFQKSIVPYNNEQFRSYENLLQRCNSFQKNRKNHNSVSVVPQSQNFLGKQSKYRSASIDDSKNPDQGLLVSEAPQNQTLNEILNSKAIVSPIMTLEDDNERQSNAYKSRHKQVQMADITQKVLNGRQKSFKSGNKKTNQNTAINTSRFEALQPICTMNRLTKENMDLVLHKLGTGIHVETRRQPNNLDRTNVRGRTRQKSQKKLKVMSIL